MILIKWDKNDADYIYKIYSGHSLEQEIIIANIIKKLIKIDYIYEYDIWYNYDVIRKILTDDDFKTLANIMFWTSEFNFTEDEMSNVLYEIIPNDSENWACSHTIESVRVLQEITF
jgi:hypothetical protein